MGEWSEYFEAFPDENPANYIDGQFDPMRADAQREAQKKQDQKFLNDQSILEAEIFQIKKKNQVP